ncbi:MAG: alpha/beta hydrolase [Pusillimonas sp.]|jgi:pimeloyl-ACP methyl ester carboxylesterase|nr:alpha/beta hydrolase [Pusillimonas sp.]MBC43119.1 alpha/beta hydrolase [Pusillimonas sp.]HCP79352.1 alpha/beta hydrolase [Pusillimonas sp.]|tara:strand:- start:67320 stop:68615 length:1296 start_codon:yes stop_codon:yes gene_type:complete
MNSNNDHGAPRSPANAPSQVTAGFLNTDWTPRDLPADAVTRNVVLRTQDQAATGGALYCPAGGADTVVCIMHPREFMACHYLVPDIVSAGYAAWSQWPRSVGNDLRLEHEIALFDVAAAMAYLREAGFRHIIFLGNSGGSGLYSLYIQQAGLSPAQRIAKTPAGRPTGLAELNMPQAQGMIFVAPHPGQGALLMQCIDPSVTDEQDPFSVDAQLDPFSNENGYHSAKEGATYSPEFIERYRQAQHARVARLDAIAHELVAKRMQARKKVKAGDASEHDRKMAAHTPVMTVWRTDADLNCFDLTLDPSDRKPGSLWGNNPTASNYGSVGFARFCSPESWLSTWSGISSNALLKKTLPALTQPTLLIEYTGDQACFPSTIRNIFSDIASTDKQHERVKGDHHGRALSPEDEAGRYIAGRLIQDWLKARFPAKA